MADEKPEAAGKPRKGKRLVVVVLLIVVLAGGAVAALYFSGNLPMGESPVSAEGSEEGSEVEDPASPDKGDVVYIPLDPPFTVNLQGGSRTRFLQASVQVMTYDAQMEELVVKHMPVIRNALVMLLSSKDADVLDSREGKESLRTEALAAIQGVLREETGSDGVEGVFFTSFVMQ